MPRILIAAGRWLLFRLTAVFAACALLGVAATVIGFAEGDYVGGVVGVVLTVLLAYGAWWTWRARERSQRSR